MKVFVCYGYTPYEGCSYPLTVFLEKSSAIEWCKKEDSKKYREYEYYEYEEMEV